MLMYGLANQKLTLLTFLCLAVILLYSPFLNNPFVFDDYFYPFSSKNFDPLKEPGLTLNLRSLPYATITWTRELLGTNIVWLRLGGLLLHIAVTLCLFLLLESIFSTVLPRSNATPQLLSSIQLAAIGALIFALHPVMVFAVGYLNQRSILMATLFSLISWFWFIKGLQGKNYLYLLVSIFAFACATFAKEHSIMAPSVALILAILLNEFNRNKLKPLLFAFLGYAIIASLVIQQIKAHHILGEAYQVEAKIAISKLGFTPPPIANTSPKTELAVNPFIAIAQSTAPEQPSKVNVPESADGKQTHVLSILTESRLFFHYLGFWLFPNLHAMSIDMYASFATRIWSLPELIGFLCFIIYPCIGFNLLRKRGLNSLLGFALLCPWLLFTTEFAVIRVQETFVLYRSYLWMPATLVALPLLNHLLQRKIFIGFMASMCSVLFILSWQQLTTFADPIKLWQDASRLIDTSVENNPGAERPFYNRGLLLVQQQRQDEALTDFSRAIELAKDQGYIAVNAYHNRGLIYLQRANYPQALADFDHAIRLEPSNMMFYANKSEAFKGLNNPDAAQEALKQGFLANSPFKFP